MTSTENKNFFVKIINNDEVNLTLPNEDRLVVVLERDLDYRQKLDIYIKGCIMKLNEWTDKSHGTKPKRWSKDFNKSDGTGLTDFEKTNVKKEDTKFSEQMKRFRTKNMKW